MRRAVVVCFLVGPVCALLTPACDRPNRDHLPKPVPQEILTCELSISRSSSSASPR